MEEVQGPDGGKKPEVEENWDVPGKVAALCRAIRELDAQACPVKVIREDYIPWMTTVVRKLTRRRNEARRDMRRRRAEWVKVSGQLMEKTRYEKRAAWRRKLDKIAEGKNTNRARSVIRSMKGDRAGEAKRAMLYKGQRIVTLKQILNEGGAMVHSRDRLTTDPRLVPWALPGNEEADSMAEENCALDQTAMPLGGSTRRAKVARGLRGENNIRHEALRRVYRVE